MSFEDTATGAPGGDTAGAGSWDTSALSDNAAAWLESRDTGGEAGQEAATAATGGDTPGADTEARGPIPYDRFQQVVQERNHIREQFSQFEPYQEFINEAAAAGWDAQSIRDAILQAQSGQQVTTPAVQATTPEDGFASYLAERGLDAEYLTPAERLSLEENFELKAQLTELQGHRREAERQTIQAELRAEMAQLADAHPILRDPDFQRTVYAQFGMLAEQDPGVTLSQVAKQFADKMNAHTRNELARYSAGKANDAKVPVTAGGASPAPVTPPNIYGKGVGRDERARMVEEFLNASG